MAVRGWRGIKGGKAIKGGGKYFDIFKLSAVSSAGFVFGILPQLLIGMIILIVGIYLLNKDKEKNKKTHGANYYIGIVLIILGSLISLNTAFGINTLIEEFS